LTSQTLILHITRNAKFPLSFYHALFYAIELPLISGGGVALYEEKPKNMIIGILAAIFFQSFGLLYSSTSGGITMTALLFLGYLTYYLVGESPYSFIFFWIQPPLNVIWSIIAIASHNKKIMREIQGMDF